MAGGKAAYQFMYSFSLTPAQRCSGTTAAPATLLQRAFDLKERRVTPRDPPPCFFFWFPTSRALRRFNFTVGRGENARPRGLAFDFLLPFRGIDCTFAFNSGFELIFGSFKSAQ